jgi:hypothetical protein
MRRAGRGQKAETVPQEPLTYALPLFALVNLDPPEFGQPLVVLPVKVPSTREPVCVGVPVRCPKLPTGVGPNHRVVHLIHKIE